jgi:hypothetical protein
VRDLLHLSTFGWVVSRTDDRDYWNAEPVQNEMRVVAPLPEGFFLVGRVVRFSNNWAWYYSTSSHVCPILPSYDDLI